MIKCFSFLIFFFVLLLQGQAQNNSIRGIVWGIGEPIYTIGVWQAALTYERNFNQHHAFVIDGSIVIAEAPGFPLDGTFHSTRYGGSVSYRYYFVSEKRFINKFWLSPGIRYQNYFYEAHNRTSEKEQSDFYGVRVMAGKQVNVDKRKIWLIDIGLGLSYGLRIYSYYKHSYQDHLGNHVIVTDLPDPGYLFLPDFVFRVGVRF